MPELTQPMVVSGVILILTFVGIFTEQIHGIERAKFAMAGAGAIIIAGQIYGFYSPEQALESIDWNVVFLLACMMVFISIMISTGGFDHLAEWLASMAGRSHFMLVTLLGTAVTIVSMMLDNVTTVIIFGPLIILIARTVGVSPIPSLMAAALLSDTGGVATLVGDPPNLMIGSAANIDFNTFIYHMGPPVLIAWFGTLFSLRWVFRKEFRDPITHVFDKVEEYKDKSLWYKSLAVMAMMVVLFTISHNIGWEPWMVAAAGLTTIVFWSNQVELQAVTSYVETPLLMFFIALFMVIGGVQNSGLLTEIGEMFRHVISNQPVLAALTLLWVSAILSAMIDNIPFTAAMIPVLLGLHQQGVNVSVMWWALAMGVGMGGNGTHIGSTANVYIVTISERLARETGDTRYQITPGTWFRSGTPAMLTTLIICSVFIVLGYNFLNMGH